MSVFCVTIGLYRFITDGLSIPFFNLGREVHSRTATLTYTWTRTRTAAPLPDWVLYARRLENNTDAPAAPGSNADVERGMESNGKDGSVITVGPDQTSSAPLSVAEIVVPVATVEEEMAVTVVSNHKSASGDGDVTTEPTQVRLSIMLFPLMSR